MKALIGFSTIVSLVFLLAAAGQAQEPVGIFDDHIDIGEPDIPGFVELTDGKYMVDAVGATITHRTQNDQFHFAYKEMTGSFAIECTPFPIDDAGRAGLMIRQDLDPDSAHFSFLYTSEAASDGNSAEGGVFPTFRTLKGKGSKRDGDVALDYADHNGPIRLVKLGNSIHSYTQNVDGDWVLWETEVMPFTQAVYAGLAATAENAGGLGLFEFSDVAIEELPLHVEREIPNDTFEAGASMAIEITASARETVATVTIQEVVPAGSTASNIQASAGDVTDNQDGTIDWILTDLSGDATLTYDLKLGSGSSAAWQGTFTDDTYPTSFIGNDTILPKMPSFPSEADTVDIDPVFPTLIQVEQGFPWNEDDFDLLADPRLTGGVAMVSVRGFSSGSLLEYPINIAEAGTYYVFGRVRGEDGNSDSFHFGIDDPPPGTDDSRWNGNNARAYNNEWVSSSGLGLDPVPFDLEAGEHFMYLGNREDSASIDWLCFTTDPDMNLSAFDDAIVQTFVVNRILPYLEYTLPASIDVSVELTAREGADIALNETPPPGWTVSGISASAGTASLVGETIEWTSNASGTLTYTVTPSLGAVAGGFIGDGVDQASGYAVPTGGDPYAPSVLNFALATDPIDVGSDTVFIQAESPHAFSGELVVKADSSLVSVLYVESLTTGRTSSVLDGQELTFNLNVLQAGTYYLFANCRSEDSGTDSFIVGFDQEFQGLDYVQEVIDPFGYQISARLEFGRAWYQTYDPAGRFWDTTGEPRAFDLTAGAHTLNWHSRESEAKVDWIAITTDPAIDIDALLEPGEETSVENFMLY